MRTKALVDRASISGTQWIAMTSAAALMPYSKALAALGMAAAGMLGWAKRLQ